jgi:hypothetical protein
MKYTTLYDPDTARSISALALRIMDTNLCKEIMLDNSKGYFYAPYIPKTMKPKYKFSRAKWYEAEFWDVSALPDNSLKSKSDWCKEQFGPHPESPDAWSRWYVQQTKVYFRDQKDHNWFVLRWGA